MAVESIVKYNGDIQALANSLGLPVDILNESYAIMELSPVERLELSMNPQIEYIEEQKLMSLLTNPAITAACITPVQRPDDYGLTGEGVLIAILDSGIDYTHKDFCNDDNTTRIAAFWDQNAQGTPPPGFTFGSEFTSEDINAALNGSTQNVPARDNAGHGTAVAGVAAGNGRASNGNYIGSAPQSSLLIVKLAQNISPYITSDTNLMRGIKYALDTAVALNMPLVINISYGTNQGSHDGSSLFEQYIDDMADRWKTSIVVATGNEGISGKHFHAHMATGNVVNAQFTVQSRLERLSITMLKYFVDNLELQIISGTGSTSSNFDLNSNHTIVLGSVQVIVTVLQPTPYNADQNVTLIFNDLSGNGLMATIWTIRIIGVTVVNGNINMWLPVTEISGAGTSFLTPETNTTLTLPSTVANAVSVGGYDGQSNTFAEFSGRGFTINSVVKPEICAPAVNVLSTSIGGGYSSFTGTSFAAPITAGACALMMQWGIIQGNNIYMYGQRLKAFLEYGAVQHASHLNYPNTNWGYGALCLKNSLDYARLFLYLSGAAPANTAVYQNQVNELSGSEVSIMELPQTFDEMRGLQQAFPDGVNPAIDESYSNFVIRYDPDSRRVLSQYPDIVLTSVLQDTYAMIQMPAAGELEYELTIGRELYIEHSILCGLLDNPALEAAGITAVQQHQNLGLTGKGVLIGMIDTGIDYTLDTFRYQSGKSRVLSIWDQSVQTGSAPKSFIYGSEYTNRQINEALASDEPLAVVPSTDEIGHGTFLASLMAGRKTDANDEGAAPDAQIVAVKLKKAKQAVKNFNGLTEPDINAYESVDIMNGIEYLLNVAKREKMPIVICIGLGSHDGAHDGLSYFEQFLTMTAAFLNVVIVTAAGNEGDMGHHAAGRLAGNEDMQEIEFNVARQSSGFFLSLWAFAPDRLSISLITPLGDIVERRKFMTNEHTTYSFVLEQSQVAIDYVYPSFKNGAQAILIRLRNPHTGLWKLQVYGDLIIDGRFNIWMPVSTLWNNSSYFLQPQVEITVTIPSTAQGVISCGAYNSESGSIYVSSSRGPNLLKKLCPDLVAPGVDVFGVYAGGKTGTMTGTSAAAAITAGACALTLQWAVVEGNDRTINTIKMRVYLLAGLTQRPYISYPDSLWGYGELNLLESFRNM